ncbi:hypothetical protein JW868_03575 [Candidatus Woesearchaeota archaeon]|nr:hypothetical protein [Candidatus Woesearchaeota archaeon]
MTIPLTSHNVFNTANFVRYKGVFDIEGLYRLIVDWFHQHHFHYEEQRIKDRVGSTTDQKIDIRGWRNWDEMVKYDIGFKIRTYDLKFITVEENGVKKDMVVGRIHIPITAQVTFDWQGKYKNNKWFAIWIAWLYHREWESKHIDGLYYLANDLMNEIKKFLGMEDHTNYYRSMASGSG